MTKDPPPPQKKKKKKQADGFVCSDCSVQGKQNQGTSRTTVIGGGSSGNFSSSCFFSSSRAQDLGFRVLSF